MPRSRITAASLAAERLNAAGLRCKAVGRYREGRACYERALALLGGPAGADREAIATIYHNLGGIEHARGNYADAEVLARRGLELRRSAPDARPRDLAADIIALAAILDGLHRDEEAEALYLEGIRLLRRTADRDRLELAVACNGLGALRVRQGRLAQGEALLEHAAALKRGILGAEHPDLAITLNNLAVARRRRGDVAGAAALYRAVLDVLERSLGPNHPTSRACRANAARSGVRAAATARTGETRSGPGSPMNPNEEEPMQTPHRPEAIHLQLTKEQRALVREVIGRDGEEIELRVEELEERIAPKLASNHNETMLIDS